MYVLFAAVSESLSEKHQINKVTNC